MNLLNSGPGCVTELKQSQNKSAIRRQNLFDDGPFLSHFEALKLCPVKAARINPQVHQVVALRRHQETQY